MNGPSPSVANCYLFSSDMPQFEPDFGWLSDWHAAKLIKAITANTAINFLIYSPYLISGAHSGV